ncbi:MAG: hypothetical protein NTX50_23140, partial [Candidatus Sumerlaeota bacterium]|nr:hypothetical protein [Candidatus Sumerlaeota bacterium]
MMTSAKAIMPCQRGNIIALFFFSCFAVAPAPLFAGWSSVWNGVSKTLAISGSLDCSTTLTVSVTSDTGLVKVNGADPVGGPCLASAVTSLTFSMDLTVNSDLIIDYRGITTDTFTSLGQPLGVRVLYSDWNHDTEFYGSAFADAVTIDPSVQGNSTIYGYAGNDILRGGAGPNTIYGGEGNDVIYGGMIYDYLDGGPGDDIIYGGSGNVETHGGHGNDRIYGVAGYCNGGMILYGEEGNDLLDVSASYGNNFYLYGGEGDDVLIPSSSYGTTNYLYGGLGNDVYIINSNNVAGYSVIEDDGGTSDAIDLTSATLGYYSEDNFDYDNIDFKIKVLLGEHLCAEIRPSSGTGNLTIEHVYFNPAIMNSLMIPAFHRCKLLPQSNVLVQYDASSSPSAVCYHGAQLIVAEYADAAHPLTIEVNNESMFAGMLQAPGSNSILLDYSDFTSGPLHLYGPPFELFPGIVGIVNGFTYIWAPPGHNIADMSANTSYLMTVTLNDIAQSPFSSADVFGNLSSTANCFTVAGGPNTAVFAGFDAILLGPTSDTVRMDLHDKIFNGSIDAGGGAGEDTLDCYLTTSVTISVAMNAVSNITSSIAGFEKFIKADKIYLPNVPATWTVMASNGATTGPVYFEQCNEIFFGSGNDSIVFQSAGGAWLPKIHGGSGTNVLNFGDWSGILTADLEAGQMRQADGTVMEFDQFQRVIGGSATDAISGPGAGAAWDIGTTRTFVAGMEFDYFDYFQGGAGDDVFVPRPDSWIGSRPGAGIDGGGGNNTLDLSALESGVWVDQLHGKIARAGATASLANCQVIATDYADTYFGGLNDDAFDPRGGLNRIQGGWGNDTYWLSAQGAGLAPVADPYGRMTVDATSQTAPTTFALAMPAGIAADGAPVYAAAFPVPNRALSFDGSSGYVEAGSSASLRLSGDLTLECRVYLNRSDVDQGLIVCNALGGTAAGNYLYGLLFETNGVTENLKVIHEHDPGVSITHTFNATLAAKQWHYIALTRDATAKSYTMYVNGSQIGSWTYSQDPSGGESSVCALGTDRRSGWNLDGRIDDAQVWSVIRTQAQIRADMQGVSSGAGNGLVLSLNMDEGQGGVAQDSTANHNDGVLKNSVSWADGRLADTAMRFDGVNDYASVANESAFDFTEAMTLECWFRIGRFDRAEQTLISKGVWRLHRGRADSDTLTFSTPGLSDPDLRGRMNINDGQWHHAAAVYDGANKYLYIDGDLDVATSASGSLATNDLPLQFGDDPSTPARYLNGWLDEIRIWVAARSQAEVRAGMFRRLSGAETGLAGYWSMDHFTQDLTSGGSDAVYHGGGASAEFSDYMSDLQPQAPAWLEFDGVNASALANDPSLFITGDATVECWVWLNAVSGTQRIVSWGAGTLPDSSLWKYRYELRAINDSGTDAVGVWMIQSPDSSTRSYQFDARLRANRWYHLAVTRATTSSLAYTLYVDGAAAGTRTDTAQTTPSSSANGGLCYLGAGFSSGDKLNGRLDDVRIWDRCRTQNEIRGDMNRRLNGGEADLIAWWPVDADDAGTATLRDHGTNSDDCAMSGGLAAAATTGKCLSFDAATQQYMRVGANTALRLRGDMTLEAWIWLNETSQTMRLAHEAQHLFGVEIQAGGQVGLFHRKDLGGDWVDVIAANLGAGRWYHIAVSRAAAASRYDLFINGVRFGSCSYTGGVSTTAGTGAMDVGAREDYAGYFWDGRMAELRLWGRARSEAEVRRDMNRRLLGTEPGLVVCYRMDDGTGESAADSTPNGLNGALYNNPVWTALQGIALQPTLAVKGGLGANTVCATNQPQTWHITAIGIMEISGAWFTGIRNLQCGADADTILFEPDAALAGVIDGGAGAANTLDYSKCYDDLAINLAAGTATGTNGIRNFRNVLTGSGDDTITADGQDNALTGGMGDDTYLFHDDWGSDEVIEESVGGYDTLDFSAVTRDLTVQLAIGVVTDGVNVTTDTNGQAERIKGGAGNDVFIMPGVVDQFASGTGTLDGGAGVDTLDYSAWPAPITVNLVTGEATGLAHAYNFENVIAGAFGTTLTLGPGEGVTTGSSGDDHYYITNGWGNRTIADSGGYNVLDFSQVTANLTFTINFGSIIVTDGINVLTAPNNFAQLIGGHGDDVFRFGAAGVTLAGGAGHIDGGPGSNTLDYSTYVSGVTVRTILGTAPGLSGFAHIQNITGGAGDDHLIGDIGPNVLKGSGGADILEGGGGSDTFVFGDEWGYDLVITQRDGGINFMDFSSVPTSITFSLGTGFIANITSGIFDTSNTVVFDPVSVQKFRGGQGDDLFYITSSTATGFWLDGGDGDDAYNAYFGIGISGDIRIDDTGTTGTSNTLTAYGTDESETYSVSSLSVLRYASGGTTQTLRFNGKIQVLTVYGNGGDDSFDPAYNSPDTTLVIDGGAQATQDRLAHYNSTESPVDHPTGPGEGYFTEPEYKNFYYRDIEQVVYVESVTSKMIGNVLVNAVAIQNGGAGIWSAQGATRFNGLLTTTGPVELDENLKTIQGHRDLVLRGVPGQGDMTLTAGDFTIDAGATGTIARCTPQIIADNVLRVSGVDSGVNFLDFDSSFVWVNGWFQTADPSVPFDRLRLDKATGAAFDAGSITLGNANVFPVTGGAFTSGSIAFANLALPDRLPVTNFRFDELRITTAAATAAGAGGFRSGPLELEFVGSDVAISASTGLTISEANATSNVFAGGQARVVGLALAGGVLSASPGGTLTVGGFSIPFASAPDCVTQGLSVSSAKVDFASGRDINPLSQLVISDSFIQAGGGTF